MPKKKTDEEKKWLYVATDLSFLFLDEETYGAPSAFWLYKEYGNPDLGTYGRWERLYYRMTPAIWAWIQKRLGILRSETNDSFILDEAKERLAPIQEWVDENAQWAAEDIAKAIPVLPRAPITAQELHGLHFGHTRLGGKLPELLTDWLGRPIKKGYLLPGREANP